LQARYTTFKIKDVEPLCCQRFEEIGQEQWENVCQHVEKLEQLYCELEGIIEDAIDRKIMKDNGVDSSDSSDASSDLSESEGLSRVEELELD
jgi:hypothetical protein